MPNDPATGPVLGTPTGAALGSALSLDAIQTASARETWISLGLDAARFDAALGQPAPAGTPATGGQSADPGDGNPGAPQVGHRFSNDQVTAAIRALQAVGMPDEKILEAIANDGYEVHEASEDLLASMRHDAEWGLDKPANPAEMTIAYREYGIDPRTVTPAQDMELRQFAASLRMEAAAPVMGELIGIVAKVDRMSPEQQTLWQRSEKQDAIAALGGPDAYLEAVERVDGFFRALPDSQLKRSLIAGPASKSSYFIRTMNSHVKRIDAWHASRPGGR